MIYSEFKPTGFDLAGLGLPDRQDWRSSPVSRTRDSGPLDESNFETVLKDLGDESETVEVHRFGHWGPGWFEIILVHPSRADAVDEWERALADYPVADEMDLSQREYDEAEESWNNWGRSGFERALRGRLGHAAADLIDWADSGLIDELAEPMSCYESHSDGPHWNLDRMAADLDRKELALLVKSARAAYRKWQAERKSA